jgi:sugar diacid utilization regulator
VTAEVVERRPRVSIGADGEVRRHMASVAAELTQHLGDVTFEMRDLLALRVHELDGDPVLLELLAASIEGNVVNILRALQHDIANDRQEPPTAAVEYARRLAQRGVPVNALVRAYRLGQQFLLSQAFDASRRLGGDEAVRVEAYNRIVNSVFDYIDWISQRVVVVYEEEREAWLANRSNARTAKVLQVLEGADLDVAATEKVMGYRLSGHHVAVVAWMHESAVQSDQLSRTTRMIRQFASEVGGGSPLVMGCDRATAWGWVPVPRGWSFHERLTTWRPGDSPAPVLALGSSRSGLDGFRTSHEEALRVHRIASLGGVPERSVVSHDEPGIAATTLLAQNLGGARAWMRSVLGDLLRDDETTARLRFTLLTLLRHDMNYTTTAEAMVMHKNSIKYRLTSAESILGRPVAENRLDVELALAACEWLGPAVLSPVDD